MKDTSKRLTETQIKAIYPESSDDSIKAIYLVCYVFFHRHQFPLTNFLYESAMSTVGICFKLAFIALNSAIQVVLYFLVLASLKVVRGIDGIYLFYVDLKDALSGINKGGF